MTTRSTLQWVLLAKAGAGIVLTLGFAAGWWLRAHGLDVGDFVTEMKQGSDPRFEWRSVDKKHWQVVTGQGEPTAVTDAREANGAGCPAGMVRVHGNYRLETGRADATGEIERIQDGACTDWISRDFPARCRTFDAAKITDGVARLPTKALDFCIDRFEYPNVLGQAPMIVVTFREAEAVCKKGGKRLCSESEWTFACEGEEVRPYPYGHERDPQACVLDRPWRPFKEGALQPRDGDGAREELDRLWQAEPSGSRGGCKSPFGVYDMTGNVDEWTRSVKTTGYASILKGGYWGPVRARCRPSTRAHNEDFVAYQQSFRCCAESNASVPAPVPPVAHVVSEDAGAKAASLDAGSHPVAADLPQGWDDKADELEAIRRARVGLKCSGVPGAPGAGIFAIAALGAAIVARRARR
jgi:hypothetical protein